MFPETPLAIEPGRSRTRLLLVLLLVLVFGAALAATLVLRSDLRILSVTSTQLISQVEDRVGEPGQAVDLASSHSPVVVWLAARMVGEAGDALQALDVLDGISVGGLTVLVVLLASFLVGPFWGVLAAVLFLLHPQVQQRFMETGTLINLASLLGPALLLGAALTRSRTSSRLVWCMVAGTLGGLAVFVHHLCLWTMVGATLGMFVAVRPRLRDGVVNLPPLGLELAAVLLFFVASAAGFYKLTGMEGKAVVEYLFGPLKAFHPAMSVAGTIYREVVDGGPPLWTAGYLWLVRTPLSLWLLAGVGGTVVFATLGQETLRPGLQQPALLLVPGGALTALLIIASLAGSPLYSGTLNLLAPLALWPALLAALGAATVVRQGGRDARGKALLMCIALLPVFHLALVGARHFPHSASYASVLAGGSSGALAGGESLYLEPTLDEDAAEAVMRLGPKIVVAPEGILARPVLARFAQELGVAPPVLRPGGALPALILGGISSPDAASFLDYCNGSQVAASLTVDDQVLWCVVDPGVAQ